MSEKYKNFGQFVGYHVPGQALTVKLNKGWSVAKPQKGKTLVILTQPQVRRTLGIMETPKSVTVEAQDQRLQVLLDLSNNNAAAHVAKFDKQAEEARLNKEARALVGNIQKILALGIKL